MLLTRVDTSLSKTHHRRSGALFTSPTRYRRESPGLSREVDGILTEAARALADQVTVVLRDRLLWLRDETAGLRLLEEGIRTTLQETSGSVELGSELETSVTDLGRIEETLKRIGKLEEELLRVDSEAKAAIVALREAESQRLLVLTGLRESFEAEARRIGEIAIGIESRVDAVRLSSLGGFFDKRSPGPFCDREGTLDLNRVRSDPEAWLLALETGDQRLRAGAVAESVAAEALALTEEVRLTAVLDGDSIGGFGTSSMTPGKQALFALSLILGEGDEPWPLLIDQPEDDLDSRSVFDQIVPFLLESKKGRQILMVSHDANLVVGADAEQVLVANRHGVDRPNRDSRTFDFLAGSLEHTFPMGESPWVLERGGIREHACEVLDGGPEAFAKRRRKYHIS